MRIGDFPGSESPEAAELFQGVKVHQKIPSGRFFPERFFLDYYEDQVYFNSIEECAAYVSRILGIVVAPQISAISDALERASEEDREKYYNLYRFEVEQSSPDGE